MSRSGWRSLLLTLGLLITIGFFSLSPLTGLTWLLGCGIGIVLVHYRFGFSSAYRHLLRDRDGSGFYPQCLLLAVLLPCSAAAILLSDALGISLRLSRPSIGLSFLLGAFLFGIGMQLARGCGCGTLAGAARPGPGFLLTLAGLMGGVFLGTLHRPAWASLGLPGLPPLVWLDFVPLPAALLLQFLGLAIVLAVVWLWTGRGPKPSADRAPYLGAILLALLATGLLLVTGEPWKVLWGLGLAAAHLAQSFGWDHQSAPFWTAGTRPELLASPLELLRQDAVVVDLGLLFGATANGLWQGSYRWGIPPLPMPALLARTGGGLLMGYGGFLSSGCNVNGFLGGVISFGLHGWAWLGAALAGSWIALRWSNPQRMFAPGE